MFTPHLMSGANKLITDYTFQDWIWAFWKTNNIQNIPTKGHAYPICYQLWFIRDLIIVSIFTPIIYFFINRLKLIPIILLGIVWISKIAPPITGFSSTAFFFFSIGAYFSIRKKSFLIKKTKVVLLTFLYISTSALLVFIREQNWADKLLSINTLIGCFCIFNLVAICIQKEYFKENLLLANCSFFVYAYHTMPLAFAKKISERYITLTSDIELLILYFICPILTIIIGVFIYYYMNKLLPRATAILTGGR